MQDATEQKTVVTGTPPAPAAPPAAPTPPDPQKNKAKKKKRRKLVRNLILLAILLVAVAVGIYFLVTKVLNPPEEKGTPMTDFVTRSSIVSKVEGSGNTKAKDSATITPESGGTVLELYVQEGDYVTAGTQLYSMDDSEARETVQKARDSLLKAQENVKDVQDQIEDIYDSYNDLAITAPHDGKMIEIAENLKVKDDVAKGKAIATIVDDTKLKLSLYFSYSYENDIAVGQTAQVSIPATMSSRTGTVETINKVRYIVPEGSVLFEVVIVVDNPGTLTQDMEATAVLKAADGSDIYPYQSGKFTYYQTTELLAKADGPVEEVHLLNYKDVKAGDLLVQLGTKDTDKQLNDKKESLKTVEDALDEAQKTLDEALEKQGNYNATAPIDGTVIACNLTAGNRVESGQAITIADTSVMTVEIQVDERNIRYVQPGMMVELNQYNENFYTGIVESVSQNATAENGVATFPVVVKVDNTDGTLMSNMYLQYSFVASQSDDCLVVPVQAVKYVSFAGINGGGSGGMMEGGDLLPTESGMLPTEGGEGDMFPADGGDGSDLPADSLPPEGDGDAGDGAGVDAALPEGDVVALPQSSTAKTAVAQPLGMVIMGGGSYAVSGGSSGTPSSSSGNDDTGTVCFVKGGDDGKTPPPNAIEADESWEVPEGFYPVPVTVGLADTMNVEITSGLTEGQEVFLGYETQNANNW